MEYKTTSNGHLYCKDCGEYFPVEEKSIHDLYHENDPALVIPATLKPGDQVYVYHPTSRSIRMIDTIKSIDGDVVYFEKNGHIGIRYCEKINKTFRSIIESSGIEITNTGLAYTDEKQLRDAIMQICNSSIYLVFGAIDLLSEISCMTYAKGSGYVFNFSRQTHEKIQTVLRSGFDTELFVEWVAANEWRRAEGGWYKDGRNLSFDELVQEYIKI